MGDVIAQHRNPDAISDRAPTLRVAAADLGGKAPQCRQYFCRSIHSRAGKTGTSIPEEPLELVKPDPDGLLIEWTRVPCTARNRRCLSPSSSSASCPPGALRQQPAGLVCVPVKTHRISRTSENAREVASSRTDIGHWCTNN